MKKRDIFTSVTDSLVPQGDAARQAIDSLRGYVYQVTAAALAWLDVEGTSKIFLEVAEDYAVVAAGAVSAVQVKDTQASGNVTLNTESVRDAISSFVTLTALNHDVEVHLRYFTTSEIGTEKAMQDRPGGVPFPERHLRKRGLDPRARKIADVGIHHRAEGSAGEVEIPELGVGDSFEDDRRDGVQDPDRRQRRERVAAGERGGCILQA